MLRGHIYTYTGWGRGRGMPLKSEVIQATNQPAPLSRIDAPSVKREGRRNWHQAAAFLYTAAQTRSDFIHCTVSHSLWAAAGHTGSGEQGKTRHGQLSPLWSSPQRSSSFGLYSPRTLKAQPRVLAAVQNIRREKASVCVWTGQGSFQGQFAREQRTSAMRVSPVCWDCSTCAWGAMWGFGDEDAAAECE